MDDRLLYWLSILLYLLQPSQYLKAIPLLLLGTSALNLPWTSPKYKTSESTFFIRVAFGCAGIGDFFLDNDSTVVIGTLLFCLTNLFLGVDFMLDNYYMHICGKRPSNNWVIFGDVLTQPMLIVPSTVSVGLFWVCPSWMLFFLFSTYSFCISFALFQSLTLQNKPITKISMVLFVISDLLVLLQFMKVHSRLDPAMARTLHYVDLFLYWSAMFGIRISCFS